DQGTVPRMNDPRRDRKILVAVGLSGSQVARGGHGKFGLHWSWHDAGANRQRMRGICEPHIGEYATKTNAICDRQHM
ncbi:hypothetical protein V8940_19705, partial [Acinetobacter pittii]|uniref:hypothetical protein n=1 Tax=Acinetobacter pittii TaxID=48296 RepID=UPI00300CC3F4